METRILTTEDIINRSIAIEFVINGWCDSDLVRWPIRHPDSRSPSVAQMIEWGEELSLLTD
jgi:hypothetical protein